MKDVASVPLRPIVMSAAAVVLANPNFSAFIMLRHQPDDGLDQVGACRVLEGVGPTDDLVPIPVHGAATVQFQAMMPMAWELTPLN